MNAVADEAVLLMNTSVMDRQIADKTKTGGQKLISNIAHCKAKAKVRKEIDKGKEAGYPAHAQLPQRPAAGGYIRVEPL